VFVFALGITNKDFGVSVGAISQAGRLDSKCPFEEKEY
jgi:hypothetical protein